MANEVQNASQSESAKAVSRLLDSMKRLSAARARLFSLRQTLGLSSMNDEPPSDPEVASVAGFFPTLGSVAAVLETMTVELNGEIDAVASAFK